MIFKVIADSLVVLHFIFIAFVVFGGLLALKWKKVPILHIPCVLWGMLVEFNGWICPLTPLENQFRELAGEVGYTGGFISYYLMPLIYPTSLTREIQILLGIVVLAINLCVYGFVIRKKEKSLF